MGEIFKCVIFLNTAHTHQNFFLDGVGVACYGNQLACFAICCREEREEALVQLLS